MADSRRRVNEVQKHVAERVVDQIVHEHLQQTRRVATPITPTGKMTVIQVAPRKRVV